MTITKNDIKFTVALICAICFAFLGMIWVYWIALIIGYPFGLVSFFIWRTLQKAPRKRNKAIPLILVLGLVISLATLLVLVINN